MIFEQKQGMIPGVSEEAVVGNEDPVTMWYVDVTLDIDGNRFH